MNTRNYEAMAAFRHVIRKFLRYSKDLLVSESLTPDQYQALLAIRAYGDNGKFSIRDLAEQLQIRHHSTVGIVDQLVRHEAIVRQIASDDRRKVLLALTGKGFDIVDRLAPLHEAELVRLCPQLTETIERICHNAGTFDGAASHDGSAHALDAPEQVR